MKSNILLFSVLAVIWISYATALQEDTMDTFKTYINLREPSFGFSSSGILKSHNGLRYTVGRNKTLYVSAPSGYRILVAIRLIDLRPNSQDQLKLFSVNGQVTPVTKLNSGSYKNRKYYPLEDQTFEVPNGKLGVTFTTGPYNTNYGYDGFELIYTVQANWFQCDSTLFYCDNGRCIANILKCDGHNHCGDRSNQKYCNDYVPSSGKTIGVAFGTIFLVIAIACGVFIIVRRAKGAGAETRTVITSHPPPTTNLPSYPPTYPPPGTYYPPPPPPYSQGLTNPAYQ